MQVLKTALDWCNSPHVTVLATPQLIATIRLIRLQTEQQEGVKSHGHSWTRGGVGRAGILVCITAIVTLPVQTECVKHV
jgi:hypothetical protein